MTIGRLAALYGACAAVFFALDFAWLSVATGRIYRPFLGGLLAEKPKVGVAAVFYLAYVVGIVLLTVLPALREGSVIRLIEPKWKAFAVRIYSVSTSSGEYTNSMSRSRWR